MGCAHPSVRHADDCDPSSFVAQLDERAQTRELDVVGMALDGEDAPDPRNARQLAHAQWKNHLGEIEELYESTLLEWVAPERLPTFEMVVMEIEQRLRGPANRPIPFDSYFAVRALCGDQWL